MSKYINLVTNSLTLDPIGSGKVIGILGPEIHWASRRTVKRCWYTYKKYHTDLGGAESFAYVDQLYWRLKKNNRKALNARFGDHLRTWETWMNIHGYFEGQISLMRKYDMQYFRKPQEVEVRVPRVANKDTDGDWVEPVYFVPREPRGYEGLDFTCVNCGFDHRYLHHTPCLEQLSERTKAVLADDGKNIYFADYFFGGRPTAESKPRRRASD